MTTVQAPIDRSSARRVGPRVYRKQVLAKRTIDYPMPDGSVQKVTFDDAYLRDLATAYNDGAYDLVPFQLATGRNEHNEDPKNYGGRVIGAEVTPDGLDMLIELSEEAAELVDKTGGRLGVSPRIKAVRHVDGRQFKRAIRHVLGTLDPRQQNLRPWQPVVDLAADDDGPVLDLTGITYQEGVTMPRIIDLSTLTDEDLEALESFTAANGIDLAAAEVEVDPDDEPDMGGETPEDEDPDEDLEELEEDPDGTEDGEDTHELGLTDGDGISDEDLNALIDAELDRAGVDLSAGDEREDEPEDVSLSSIEPESPEAENARLRFENAADKLLRKGVPPAIIDLAKPILSLSDEEAGTLDLATPAGESVDVRGVVRDMLEAVAGTIDLSSESGYGHETEPEEQEQATAQVWIDYLANN